MGFVPESIKDSVIEDLNLIIAALENIVVDFTYDSYIAEQGFNILDLVIKYYELKVLDIENISPNL